MTLDLIRIVLAAILLVLAWLAFDRWAQKKLRQHEANPQQLKANPQTHKPPIGTGTRNPLPLSRQHNLTRQDKP